MKLIDAKALKNHYAWWGDDNKQKKIFDTIVDLQPTIDAIPTEWLANHGWFKVIDMWVEENETD